MAEKEQKGTTMQVHLMYTGAADSAGCVIYIRNFESRKYDN